MYGSYKGENKKCMKYMYRLSDWKVGTLVNKPRYWTHLEHILNCVFTSPHLTKLKPITPLVIWVSQFPICGDDDDDFVWYSFFYCVPILFFSPRIYVYQFAPQIQFLPGGRDSYSMMAPFCFNRACFNLFRCVIPFKIYYMLLYIPSYLSTVHLQKN